jgi:hypothetical protein
VFEAAARLHPGVGVSAALAGGVDHVHLSPEEAAQLPPVDAWRAVPGARRYLLGTMWDDVKGVVWVVPGSQGLQIHTYRLDDDGALREAYTLDATGEVGRLVKRGD